MYMSSAVVDSKQKSTVTDDVYHKGVAVKDLSK